MLYQPGGSSGICVKIRFVVHKVNYLTKCKHFHLAGCT